MNIADMSIETFHAESGILRAIKAAEMGLPQAPVYADMARVYLYDAADRINKSAKDAINGFASGDEQRMMLLGVKRFTKAAPFNAKDARRRIAQQLTDAGKYPW